jgi:hypothetical protein
MAGAPIDQPGTGFDVVLSFAANKICAAKGDEHHHAALGITGQNSGSAAQDDGSRLRLLRPSSRMEESHRVLRACTSLFSDHRLKSTSTFVVSNFSWRLRES